MVEILAGYESGGSSRGDYVCLWRDKETGEVLIGTKENIFENEYLDAYYFNDELVTMEAFEQEQNRFVELPTP